MASSTLAKHVFPFATALLVGFTTPALSSDKPPEPKGTTIDLSAEASLKAPNDLAMASAYFEATDPDPAALSKKVNAAISEAIALAKQYKSVDTSTAGVMTNPVHSKDGRRIEAWRMRSSIRLESRDVAALSELLGKLQGSLAVSSLTLRPASDTRSQVADKAAIDAIRAFEARAESIAAALGKTYRIRHLTINHGGGQGPVYPMMRSAAFAEDAAVSMPIEGGESEITANVNGTIELID